MIVVDKKRIAKEWLFFLGFTAPWIMILILLNGPIFQQTGRTGNNILSASYREYYTLGDIVLGILGLLLPYLVFLFIRSIMWAIKTIRLKNGA